jgi:hypothetical protein
MDLNARSVRQNPTVITRLYGTLVRIDEPDVW